MVAPLPEHSEQSLRHRHYASNGRILQFGHVRFGNGRSFPKWTYNPSQPASNGRSSDDICVAICLRQSCMPMVGSQRASSVCRPLDARGHERAQWIS